SQGSSAPWIAVGGTSFSSPAWAALIAIADQGRAWAGESSLNGPSQTLPKLYGLPASDFHDITSGSNGGYSAAPGYALVTGLGTPYADRVARDLLDAPPSISGSVFEDVNGNAIKDAGEPTLSGWTVYVDSNNNGVYDSASEPGALTDSSGNYAFIGL